MNSPKIIPPPVYSAENGHEITTELSRRCATPYCHNDADPALDALDGNPICRECFWEQEQINRWHEEHRNVSMAETIGWALTALAAIAGLSGICYYFIKLIVAP